MSDVLKKLAIITTHPIQYHAPLYALLSKRKKIDFCVFYTWGESVLQNKYDPGFGKVIEWDIPLLEGYPYRFMKNTSKDPGSHHFSGIINPELIQEIETYKPDALLIYGWSFNSHLKLMRYFSGKIPVIFRGDSTLLDQVGFVQKWKRKVFLLWVYRHINTALYVGRNNFDYFRQAGVHKNQLVFGPHAIDNERFTCQTPACIESRNEIRRKINITEKDRLFLFAGKLEAKKDPRILLQAFVDLGLPHNMHLLIVGNGVLEEELRNSFGHHPCVHFMDFQNQATMPAVYAAADVFVLPSAGPGETWGLAVNEAMAAGKPVIVSDKCGCAPDLVENGKNGYIFKASNMESLQTAILNMVDRSAEWEKMGEISKSRISLFSLDNLASAIESTVIHQKNKNS